VATTIIHVDGLRQLGENMRSLSVKVAKKVSSRTTSKGAQVIKRRAKANLKTSPSVDTGLLEKNVVIKKLGKRDSKLTSEHIATVKKAAYPNDPDNTRRVANFVEYGTVKMPAEPFMRPAFDTGKSEALTAMTDELRRGIDDATKGLPK
jgi:HK97 gp10 family phage protein